MCPALQEKSYGAHSPWNKGEKFRARNTAKPLLKESLVYLILQYHIVIFIDLMICQWRESEGLG